MLLDRVILFGENLGDQVKGRSPKKLKLLIAVPSVLHVKVHVLSFNILSLSHLRSVFLHRVILFGGNLGDQVKRRSPNKLKLLIADRSVLHVKVHVLRFKMLLISSP